MSNQNKELKVENNEVQEEKKLGRRTPMYQQRALGIKSKPGFIRRQVVELPGRVESMMEAGWRPVQGADENLRDNRLQNDTQLGSVVREVVNTKVDAMSKTAVWMEIEEKFYKEDMAAKHARMSAKTASWNPKNIQESNPDVYYGADLKIESK